MNLQLVENKMSFKVVIWTNSGILDFEEWYSTKEGLWDFLKKYSTLAILNYKYQYEK